MARIRRRDARRVGVFLQAVPITAYARPGGATARSTCTGLVGGITHLIEVVVFLAALVAWWKQWGVIALAFTLPLIGTIQMILVGDTDEEGGWVNGLHGLFALVVLVARRRDRPSGDEGTRARQRRRRRLT